VNNSKNKAAELFSHYRKVKMGQNK